MSTTRYRMPAAERRVALIDAALRVFATGSYSGATTADIAREARVTEPILYRHFGCKSDLYIACLNEIWRRLRETVEEIVAAEPDPAQWPFAVPKAMMLLRDQGIHPNQMWMQALTRAGEDADLRRYMRKHMREVHAFVADITSRAQEAGGVKTDLDPSAEAWIGIGIGLLRAVQDRVGGLLTADDFDAIIAARRRSLTAQG